MENNICQSCGMPMETEEQFGTNQDGSKNPEYCAYCHKDGEFTLQITMDEMINHCVHYLDDFNKDNNLKLTKDEAVAQMKTFFSTLKRWAAN